MYTDIILQVNGRLYTMGIVQGHIL